jgi:hypothetical protein
MQGRTGRAQLARSRTFQKHGLRLVLHCLHQLNATRTRHILTSIRPLPRTFDCDERSAKSVETATIHRCGVGRNETASLSASRKPVDDYFESPWVEREPAVAGLNLNFLDVCPSFDAVLPSNYTVALRVYESLRNARRKVTHLNFRSKRGCKPAGASPMRPFKERPQKCIRALKRRFHRRTQQYRPLNQVWKPAGQVRVRRCAQAMTNNDDLSAGLAIRLAQHLFQPHQHMNRAIHVAPDTGEKIR